MLIGLMADSHDRLSYIEKAVELFNAEGVSKVLQEGDYVAPFALGPLKESHHSDFGYPRFVRKENNNRAIGVH